MTNNTKEPVVEVMHLKQVLNHHAILDDVNLVVYKNEKFGLVGGSGSGKTTLLRNILMLLKPTEGKVKVFGKDIVHLRESELNRIQRRWGVLFQHSALFSSLTVLENVMFPLRIHTDFDPQLQKKIALLKISLTGLPAHAALKYPAELSGGMQKRAALARAIALDPELLFLDEPTAGLDPRSSEILDELILHLHEVLDLTLIMVTHDLDSIARVTDRTAFLGDGKILAVDKLSRLMQEDNPLIQEYFSGPRSQRLRGT